MKKFLKNNIKLILVFLLGIIVSSGITAYAVNNYMSEQIRYQNNTFAINSVSEALDDLYSYSKNKIDNYAANNYSTEEQVVGTWIDGKPIYQRIVSGTASSNITLLNNVSNVIFVSGWVRHSVNGALVYIPFSYGTSERFFIWLIGDSVQVVVNGNCYIGQPYSIILQYTKTTDTATN